MSFNSTRDENVKTILCLWISETLTVQGDIKVDGLLIDESYMRKYSGFMHQDDLFVQTMTVSEHLWFMVGIQIEKISFRDDSHPNIGKRG